MNAFLSLNEESSDPEAFISLGDELHDRTQPPDRHCALACYERAAALDPSDAEAWTSAAHGERLSGGGAGTRARRLLEQRDAAVQELVAAVAKLALREEMDAEKLSQRNQKDTSN